MDHLETRGSWHDMGRAYGERFREPLRRCLERFCPDLQQPSPRKLAAIEALRVTLEAACPQLLEETTGMAEGAGFDFPRMLGYRFFPDLVGHDTGCSVFFVRDSTDGPLLARNCDLENDISQEIQVCHVARPTGGTSTITTGYVGLPAINGMNEHGVGLAGASAHTPNTGPKSDGLPGGVLAFNALQEAHDIGTAASVLTRSTFRGKSMNLLVGTAEGRGRVFEMVSGHPAAPAGDDGPSWLACTNTFRSGRFEVSDEPAYIASAESRYGRLTQRLGAADAPPSAARAQDLLRQIAMPGEVIPAEGCPWRTAYSQVMALRERVMWLCEGHPGEGRYREVRL